jgi:hypothetical protein
MAYWWVSQNKTFTHERDGGYLWAPLQNDRGQIPYHWMNMERVEQGDIIFSYKSQTIKAIGLVKRTAYKADRPSEFGKSGNLWETKGNRIDIIYRVPKKSVSADQVYKKHGAMFKYKYSPLTSKGTGVQGYLFELPYRLGSLILSMVDEQNANETDELIADGVGETATSETQRQALVMARNGQGIFRSDLERIWNGKCCITGLDVKALLRASHTKPWRDSNNQERLDPYNGLLLSPAYDLAFDKGYITFNDDGRIKVSSKLSAAHLSQLGLDAKAQILGLRNKHELYLKYHREQIFLG